MKFTARIWKGSVDEEVTNELDFHLEMRTRELVDRGWEPAAARIEALRRFGDMQRLNATCRAIGKQRDREMRRTEYLSELKQDATFALRHLVKNPGFALVALLTLTLGIGGTTAIYSAVHAVVLRPLPVPDPDRLMSINEMFKGQAGGVSAGNYTDAMARQTSFSAMSAVRYSSFNIADADAPERVVVAQVTANYFDVFGVRPAVGRTFLPEEDQPGNERVVMLSYRIFTRRYGGDSSIVGRDIPLNGSSYRVVGVMPASFDFTIDSEDLWVPIAFDAKRKATHDEHYLNVYARLAPGISRDRAAEDLKPIAMQLRKEFPRDDETLEFSVTPFMREFIGDYNRRLFILLGAVALVLLIGCGNVANLLLARGAARGPELAIRAALGAGRGRIVRQLLTENAVLAIIAASLGMLLAWWGIRGLVAASPPGVPRLDQTRLDWPVLIFAVVIALVSSVIFGLAPSLRAARSDLQDALRDAGRSSVMGGVRDRLRGALIVSEMALAVLLLIGAGLFIRSAIEIQRVRPGFDPTGVLSARLALPATEYADPDRVRLVFDRIAANVSAIPGIEAAALTSQAPMGNGGNGNGLIPEGLAFRAENVIYTRLKMITPGYFKTMRTPIVRGRGFDDNDRRGAQKVMIISEALAQAAWPGQDPIGKRMACCEAGPTPDSPDYKVVVGVAADVRSRGRNAPVQPEFYLPIAQVPNEGWNWIQRTMYVVARTPGDPQALTRQISAAVLAAAPGVPLFDTRTMEDRLAGSVATERFNTLLLTLLGAVGLLLSAIGIYGVLAYFVSNRTKEIGVRMALGASRGDVASMVVRQAAIPVGIGLVLGCTAAAWATRALSEQLFMIGAHDPITFATVVAALVVVALAASLIPARRAASIDPTRALQNS